MVEHGAEIVAVDQLGPPSFQALQHRDSHSKHNVVFYAFDLPYVDGIDLMNAPLQDRRAKLLQISTDSRVLAFVSARRELQLGALLPWAPDPSTLLNVRTEEAARGYPDRSPPSMNYFANFPRET